MTVSYGSAEALIVYDCILICAYTSEFSLEIYFQMVHNITIGRYETLSLHTAIEVGSQLSNCCWQDLGSDPNDALT